MRLIRELVPGDRYAIASHLLALAVADRRFRFCATVCDAKVGEFARTLDWTGATHLGCFLDGGLAGVLHLYWQESEQERWAEFSLSVAGPARGRGIARDLLARAAGLARARGAQSLNFSCLPDNAAMLALAEALGATIAVEAEEARGSVRIPSLQDLPLAERPAGQSRSARSTTARSQAS